MGIARTVPISRELTQASSEEAETRARSANIPYRADLAANHGAATLKQGGSSARLPPPKGARQGNLRQTRAGARLQRCLGADRRCRSSMRCFKQHTLLKGKGAIGAVCEHARLFAQDGYLRSCLEAICFRASRHCLLWRRRVNLLLTSFAHRGELSERMYLATVECRAL
jgi:hypothetical protein